VYRILSGVILVFILEFVKYYLYKTKKVPIT